MGGRGGERGVERGVERNFGHAFCIALGFNVLDFRFSWMNKLAFPPLFKGKEEIE